MINASAPVFHSKTAPMVYMEPVNGVCFSFQFGKCTERDHHQGESSLALHVCQPCFLLRQNLVDHSCPGGHASHPQLCQQKKLGAVACPFSVDSSTALINKNIPGVTSTFSNLSQTQSQDNLCKRCEKYKDHFNHLPAFECDCDMCRKFFWGLQTELNDNRINININSEYEHFHYKSF